MSLYAWTDENYHLYVASEGEGEDYLIDDAFEVVEAANRYFVEQEESDLLINELHVAIMTKLWVDPEMIHEEQWDDRYWSDSMSDYDGLKNGWRPVLTLNLEEVS